MKFEQYWERNGKRRPFPALYEAVKAYGDRIYYPVPEYVESGRCKWCGNPIINKRRKSFCCDKCRYEYEKMTVWNRGRDAYSLRILFRDNFTCQDRGGFHAFQNEHGVYIPIDDGNLNVHHIRYVSDGGGDEPENLITLCLDCHKKRHSGENGGGENGI